MNKDKGFTLIELMVVISIIGTLSTIVLGALQSARLQANDSKRLTEVQQVEFALEMYYQDHDNHFPGSDGAGCGGWDTPGNGTFLNALSLGGYMPNIQDPSTNDDCGNYRYQLYPAGYCSTDASKGAFYVLEIISFQVLAPKNPGFTSGNCSWTAHGKYVTGKYENG